MRRLITALALLAAMLAVPALAAGAVSSASGSDPLDLQTSIDGTPGDGDIEQYAVHYDDQQGAVLATVRFYRPLSTTGIYDLTVAAGSVDQFGLCNSYSAGVNLFTDVNTSATSGTVSVGGFTDGPPLWRMVSADGRELTMWTSHPVLAGRTWNCIQVRTTLYSSTGYYSSGCGCILHTYDRDTVPDGTLAASGPGPLALPTLPPPPAPPATPVAPKPLTPTQKRCQRLPSLIRVANLRVNRSLRAVRRARTVAGRRKAVAHLRVVRKQRAALRHERAVKC